MPELSSQLTLRSVTWDIALIGFFVIAIFIYSVSGGRRLLFSFLVSSYIASAIALAVSNIRVSGKVFLLPWAAIIFVLAAVFFTWMFSGEGFGSMFRFSRKVLMSWWQMLFLSMLGTGFFVSTLLGFVPGNIPVSPFVRAIFASVAGRVFWSVLPAMFLLFLRSELQEDEGEAEYADERKWENE